VAARYGTSLDDERRLFYVALSRAKERLFLIDPELGRPERRSVFLTELEAAGFGPRTKVEEIATNTWEIDPADLQAGDPPPIRIGLSDVLLYLDCPYRYALSRIVNVEPAVGDELGYGKSLHELIQRRLDAEKPWSDKELDTAATDNVLLPYMSEEGEARARNTIKSYVKELGALGLLDAEVESEIPVEMILKGGIVHGTIDAVQLEATGSVCVRDWKSSIHAGFLRRYDVQLKFYVAALRQKGRDVSGAEIINVKETVRTRKVVKTSVDITGGSVQAAIQEIQDALDGIQEARYCPTPGVEVCEACDMRRICGERKQQ